jgi:acetyl coenzyme A synthetase (ADP forming)-like protein
MPWHAPVVALDRLDAPRPRGLDALFRPRSVAVIGTSATARTIGREILANLLRDELQGVVFPVNPRHAVVQSLKCWPSVEAIPDPVDLAVVVVPAPSVPDVARQCARKGVGGLVIISAGFREVGPAGAALEQEVLAIARDAGMRVVGPNCMGLINTDPAVRLNASFAAARPAPGPVAFVSQSGALGEAILSMAADLGLGISYFVSAGNRADVSTNDLLEYWEDDPRVGPILLYIESFGDPHRFPDIARRVSRKKPIIAVKGGRTVAGAVAARSHTGSLAGYDVTIDALLSQCGVLRVPTIEDLFATAAAISSQPPVRGVRVGIVANAGGPAILATDACVSLGLQVAELGVATCEALSRVLPQEASLKNPVDMVAQAGPEQFRAALGAVLADDAVDAVLVIFITPVYVDSAAVARAIRAATEAQRDARRKPVLTCFMGKERHSEAVACLREGGVPVYQFPESAARALAEMARRRAWLGRDPGSTPDLAVDRSAAREAIARTRAAEVTDVPFAEARGIAVAYGFPFADTRSAATLEEALDAAAELGFPLVLKATARGLSHKTDRGGVAVDLRTIDELASAWLRMRSGLGKEFGDLRFLVQRMAAGDREVILGMRRDADFGPLLMFGLGGIHVEVLHDVTFRVHPITDTDALEMIRGLRGHALLRGVRGARPVPEDLLVDLLLRLDRLVADLPELAELDLNPVMVGARREDCVAVDVRMRLGPPG